MNKKIISTILLSLVVVAGQAQTKNYRIYGNLSEVVKAIAKHGMSFDSVTVVNTATNNVILRSTIQDGVFTINGTIDKPLYALLSIWSSAEVNGDRKSKRSRIPIIIEAGDIMFDGNSQTPTISGTHLNDMLSDVISKRNTPNYTESLKVLAIQHKDDVAAIPLIPYPQILNSEKIATNINGIDALPETILFAPDGTIIARGMHGEDIERQLIVLKKS